MITLEELTNVIEKELRAMLSRGYEIRTIACELAEITRDLLTEEPHSADNDSQLPVENE